MKTPKYVNKFSLIFTILLIVAGYLLIIGILIYGFGMNNKIIQKTAKIIPYPGVIFLSGKIITLNEINTKLDSIKLFYNSQDFSDLGLRVDFTTGDGQKRLKIKERNLISKLAEDRIIEKLANKQGIKITDKMVSGEVNRKLEEYGSRDELKNTMFNLYGWQIEDFEKNIVKPDLYKEKLKENMPRINQSFAAARKKITQAQDELKNGASFEEIAKKYSEGESSQNGGSLGWFTYDQILPEVGLEAYMLEKGSISDIIESSLGYHIISIEDKKTEDAKDQVKIKQIFVRTESFADWLEKQIKTMKIYIPLKNYRWNRKKGEAEFSKEEMRKFEEDEYKSPTGDASILF